jgi:hypothetical protein
VTPEQQAFIEAVGFKRSPYPEEPIWGRDVVGGVQELRSAFNKDGLYWWPAMMGDYGDCLEDEWEGESFADPISAYVYAEVSGWSA